MVVQELIYILPQDPGSMGLIIAVVGSLIGAGIWLLGARYSRTIITLLTVLLGATIGMHLPQWLGWQISGAGPAVGMALVLGVTGYVLHGMWVGIGLGTVLASWVTMGCWILLRHGAAWTWPDHPDGTSWSWYLAEVWQSLPADVSRILPYVAGTALVSGVAAAIIWPKTSLIVGWSMAGATLLLGMGVAAADYGQPNLLAHVPSQPWAQIGVMALLVLVGSLIQWKLGPRPAISAGRKKEATPPQAA
jgi:hypothetical protein